MKPALYLINGPLGAGKTTLLRHLLKQPEFENARVIENEFASTSIDTEQLHDHVAEVTTIAGVCICCSTGDELSTALRQLASSSSPVIIEATGVANSLRLIEKLAVDDLLDLYELQHAVFVLDGAEAAHDPETVVREHRDELAAADAVVLSKTDLISAEEQTAIIKAINAVGAKQVVTPVEGKLPIDTLANPSGIVAYYAAMETNLPDEEPALNYVVIDLSNVGISPDELRVIWPQLVSSHGLRRMKGDIKDKAGTAYHVEATPLQCRIAVSGATLARSQLVLIGDQARTITVGGIVGSIEENRA